jgi:hypothetical protein
MYYEVVEGTHIYVCVHLLETREDIFGEKKDSRVAGGKMVILVTIRVGCTWKPLVAK